MIHQAHLINSTFNKSLFFSDDTYNFKDDFKSLLIVNILINIYCY